MKGYIISLALSGFAAAVPLSSVPLEERATASVVTTLGTVVGSSALGVENFGGIPFADPPVGNLRLRPPQRRTATLGTFDASGSGPSCPQFFFSTQGDLITQVLGNLTNTPFFQTVTGQTEDCLTMRVQRPAGTKPDAKLPVLFWIFGGGFELGSTQTYDASGLILNGVAQKKPFVFVSVNYRTGGFGFLPGKEVLADGAANLGLLDQRMGLEWVQDNIAAFGGDPTKVTIWGESAGSISVTDQMALYGGNNTYKGNKLFRAGIMDSGSVVPADKVDCERCQDIYDQVVRSAGCSGSQDTLQCLRSTDFETYRKAASSVPGLLSYTSVALSYLPRPDGVILPDSPDVLIKNGQYAAVPMIIGDQEDEGTLFSLFQSNITTEAQLIDYLSTVFFQKASRNMVAELVGTYSPALSAGSPFRTGILNNPYPQFKRLAAILGDLVFTLTRRLFLQDTLNANPNVPSWSYLASYDYGTPILGTFHGSDILQVFYGILPNYASNAIQSYYLSFLYTMDPNNGTSTAFANWPQWRGGNQLMNFFNDHSTLLKDDFRSGSYQWLGKNVDSLHI
ncbi:sterol esterase precursor [Xylaria flabelliformis]|nr:sterol esterase precursor [Xylaria flabelliformis]